MLVTRQGRRHRAGRARLTRATSALRCSLAPPKAQRRPLRRSGCSTGCSEERRVSVTHGEAGPPAQSRARATYKSDVSKLNAFASLSLFLPPLSSRSTIASAFIFAPFDAASRPPPEYSSLNRARRCQRRSARLLPPFSQVVRLRLRASVLSAPRPGRDGHTTTARRVRGPRARPARSSASARSPPCRARRSPSVSFFTMLKLLFSLSLTVRSSRYFYPQQRDPPA